MQERRTTSDRRKIRTVRKAIFPAAGLGTRFLPATKAQPKEMLPLVDKPIIQYGVEEALAAGCDQIIIITGRGKSAIEDHFDVSYELEKMLEEKGKHDLLKIVHQISHAHRHNDRLIGRDVPQRPPVEMIEMRVRHQDEINRRKMMNLETWLLEPLDHFQPLRPIRIDQDVDLVGLN